MLFYDNSGCGWENNVIDQRWLLLMSQKESIANFKKKEIVILNKMSNKLAKM